MQRNKRTDYSAEGKKVLPSPYTERDLDAFSRGVVYGDEHHDENHRMPDEWYEERDKHRAENAPKVNAFVGGVMDGIKKDAEAARRAEYDRIVEHTLEKLIHGLIDSSNEEGGMLLDLLVEARKNDETIKSRTNDRRY